jgi:hypothetical protein
MRSMIIGKNSICIDEEIATALGLPEAIILQKIWWWMKVAQDSKNEEIRRSHFISGRWWTYQTIKDWCKAMPYYGEKTIRRHLSGLEEKGIIITGVFNKKTNDKTKWYTVNEPMLLKAMNDYFDSQNDTDGQNDQSKNEKQGQNDQTITKEYNNNTKNTLLKFRNNNYILSNNEPYIIPKTESDVCQSPPYNIYKDNLIDIHNNEQLAHILENVTSIPKGNEGHDYIYFLFSTFAMEYKKHKGYKHKRINRDKLLRYADKLIKFTPMNLNTGESYPEKCNYSFSIFNYEKEDIEYMVKDFFAADIRESDHSLHLFMSDNILRARFWRLENKYAEASSY